MASTTRSTLQAMPQYKELPSMFGTTGDCVHSVRAFPPIRRLIGLTSLRSERQQWRCVGLRHQVKWINLIFDLFFVKVNGFHWKMCGLSLLSLFRHLEDCDIEIMHAKQTFVVNQWTKVSQSREPTRASPPRGCRSNTEGSAAVPMCWAFAGSAYKVTWHLLVPVIGRV